MSDVSFKDADASCDGMLKMKFSWHFLVLAVLLSSCTSSPPLPLDADHAKVTLSHDGTETDARDALLVATKFLAHWRDTETEKALAFVDPRLRDVWEKELVRNQESAKDITRVIEIRVFRNGRSKTLVARVGVTRANRPGGMVLDMELQEKTWVVTVK